MSIDAISSTYANPALMPGMRPSPPPDETGQRLPVRQAPEPAAQATATRASAETVPTEAPLGTDPALWSVLTSQERAFFARARTMGPVTYGPGAGRSQPTGALVGGRIDVRV